MNSVGTGITVDRASAIIEAGLGAWNFSVDTLDPALYERLRGIPGALPTIMRAIATVQEAGSHFPEFRINYMTVITRHNFRGIPGLLAHCVDRGVASVYLMNVYGDTAGQSLLTGAEIQEFRRETVPGMLAVLREKNTAEIVQANAAQVLASFFSAENPDSSYAGHLLARHEDRP
jgi:MoaA/NifB/PqqE/SkfB family radical SAM enzyme